jgi:autophagy-related protein 18
MFGCRSLAMGTRKTYALFTISQDNKIDEIYDCGKNFSFGKSSYIYLILAYDDVCIIERLFSSSLTALVSNQAPRKLKVCHFKKGTEICSYSFANTILAVKLNRLVRMKKKKKNLILIVVVICFFFLLRL